MKKILAILCVFFALLTLLVLFGGKNCFGLIGTKVCEETKELMDDGSWVTTEYKVTYWEP